EVPLNENSVVIIGKDQTKTPEFVKDSGARVVELPLDTLASETADGGENIVAAGLLAKFLGLEQGTIQKVLREHFAKKEELLSQAEDWLIAGWNLADQYQEVAQVQLADKSERSPQWLVNGSESCGLGALKAGTRFVAAYPITPASGSLEWLAPNLEKLGGSLVQAE
ncbi:hypothetical protein, partial [Oleiphilus sp. HI0132]|uniref:hypothetical protein n=1 Tax=Oleiphilus sp. HI0132 TaxID=1822270 RepID=UPI000B1F29E5